MESHSRNKQLFWLAALALILAGAVSIASETQTSLDNVDRFIESERTRQKIPGIAVAVLQHGKVVKARGYGLANVELNVAATERTIFQSGSVGKQFTAAGILLLAEDGKLKLDDNISNYFPNAPTFWKDISIRHLLTHSSGIKNYTNGQVDLRKDYSEDDLVQMAIKAGVDFPPGESWNYSNTGFVLLGVIIRKVTGQFYGDFLADRLFKPFGMDTARVISETDIVPNRADGYRLVNGDLKNQAWVSPSLNTTADGALYLTALDMARWESALSGTGFLSPSSRREWWSPVQLKGGGSYPYGMGWSIDYMRGHRVIDHGGSWQGFKTHILRYPDDGLTVIVLANLAQANPSMIAYGIAGVYEPELQQPHLLNKTITDTALEASLKQFLKDFSANDPKQDALITPGFKSTASTLFRNAKAGSVRSIQTFDLLTCDSVSELKIEWNGSPVDRYCYVRAQSPNRSSLITFWSTLENKVTGFSSYAY